MSLGSQANRVALKTSLIYLVVGLVWILTSDTVVLFLTQDPVLLTNIQIYKGFAFVISTALLIFFMVRGFAFDLEESGARLGAAYEATLDSLVRAIELRDVDTQGHAGRVTDVTLKLARALRFPEHRMEALRHGALLHDIGKIAIPDQILHKPAALSAEEWEEVHRHPELGHSLLASIDHLKGASEIPLHHHERWDGSGYPDGLKGDEIPEEARIFAVADVWDALTSDRPYRPGWEREKAFHYIVENANVLFDARVVEAFTRLRQQGAI